MYCTYLTVYSGNKLPPFYIGYKLVQDVLNGYHGSVRSKIYRTIWKSELEESPHLFKTITLTYHKTSEEARDKEEYIQKFFNVHKNPMYINRHIGNRYFVAPLKRSEESKRKQSIKMKGVPKTEDHKKKLSVTKLGIKNPNYKNKLKSSSINIRTEKQAKYWKLISPFKEIFYIQNIHKFSKDNNLSSANLVHVANGKYSHHKYWKCIRLTKEEFSNEKN